MLNFPCGFILFNAVKTDTKLTLLHMRKNVISKLTGIKFKIWSVTFLKSLQQLKKMEWTSGFRVINNLPHAH